MQLTAQGLGTAASKAKVKAFEGEFAELKAQVRRAETFFGGGDADRTKLFAGADLAVTSGDQRAAVARDTERLKHTTDVIKDALRVAGETEQIGRDSLQQLHVQGETIQASRLKIRAVDESLATASRLMRGMARRIMTNKLITLVLALIMIGGIALLVYLKWFDNPSPDDMMTSAVNGTLSTDTTNATTTAAAALTTKPI